MKVSREQGLTQPFVIEATELERFCKNLHDVTPKLSFEVSCKDQIKREFSSLAELLGFENSLKKEILNLRISGYSEDIKTRLWLRFDKDSRSNIFISLEGEEDFVMKINDYVDEYLAGLRPWYSLVARTDFTWIILIILMSVWLGIIIAAGIIKPGVFREALSVNAGTLLFQTFMGALMGMIPLVLGFILHKIRSSVFPMGSFALGQGAKRHKDKEIIRTGVIIAFIISFVSSTIVALIFAI